jgi:hypothetical protein
LAIQQAELRKAQSDLAQATDPKQKLRLEADIAGLTREISRSLASKGAPMAAPVAPTAQAMAQPQAAPQGTSFADLWESTAPTTETAKTTTQATSEKTDQQPSTGELAERFFKGTEPGSVRNLVGKFLKGGLETRAAVPGFLASAADVVAGAPSAIAGLVGYGAGRVFGLSPEEATAASQKVAAPLAAPVGRATGLAETQAYKQALPTQVMEYIGKNINEGAQSISQKFGVPVQDVEAAINATLMATGAAAPKVIGAAKKAAGELQVVKPGQVPGQPAQPGMVSMGAAAVPDAATIKQALSVATPELQKALANKIGRVHV